MLEALGEETCLAEHLDAAEHRLLELPILVEAHNIQGLLLLVAGEVLEDHAPDALLLGVVGPIRRDDLVAPLLGLHADVHDHLAVRPVLVRHQEQLVHVRL
eukprot:8513417-Pyramimonas_sp.AAC.1